MTLRNASAKFNLSSFGERTMDPSRRLGRMDSSLDTMMKMDLQAGKGLAWMV